MYLPSSRITMDFATILAKHHKLALERVAARQRELDVPHHTLSTHSKHHTNQSCQESLPICGVTPSAEPQSITKWKLPVVANGSYDLPKTKTISTRPTRNTAPAPESAQHHTNHPQSPDSPSTTSLEPASHARSVLQETEPNIGYSSGQKFKNNLSIRPNENTGPEVTVNVRTKSELIRTSQNKLEKEAEIMTEKQTHLSKKTTSVAEHTLRAIVLDNKPSKPKRISNAASTHMREDLTKLLSYISVDSADGNVHSNSGAEGTLLAEYKTAPLFSYAASAVLTAQFDNLSKSDMYPQYGLLGICESTQHENSDDHMQPNTSTSVKDRLIFTNLDAPWSAFICGSQGAGKSHTLSCLLENGLLPGSDINKLPNPLSSIVFHYDKFTGKSSTQLCEAAYLCSSGIPVQILVSPSNIWNMKELYTNLPGLPENSSRPKILPLYLTDKNLNTGTIMRLMAADAKTTSMPLYISVVHTILQEMAMQGSGGGNFSYADFKSRIENYRWLPGQRGPLDMRLRLLEGFLEPSSFTRSTKPAPSEEDIWAFEPGSLTIVDLSDPFVDENGACALFSICLSIFMESRGKSGQMIALDEAHKFLTQTGEAKILTDDLTSIIRQQRHTGTRVIIATQEPTLSPKLMDLANVTIVHRFLSPDWYQTIKKHIAAANKYDSPLNNTLFEKIVALETGEALLFCPTALLTASHYRKKGSVSQLGNNFVKIRVRKRQTFDGGRSILASDVTNKSAPVITVDVPMFVVTRPPSPPKKPYHKSRYGGSRQNQTAGQTYNRPAGIYQSVPTAGPISVSALSSIPLTARFPAATQFQANATQTPPTFQQLRDMICSYVRMQFLTGWHHMDGVSWGQLNSAVDTYFNMPKGTFQQQYLSVCRDTVKQQINTCRREKGWSEI